MDIRITVRPDTEALLRGVRFVVRKRMRMLRLAGVALIVAGLLLFLTGLGRPGAQVAVGIGIMVGGAVYELLPSVGMRRALKNRSRVLDEPRSYSFTEQGVAMSSASQSSTMVWTAFARIVDTGDDLLLMPSRNQVIVVPRAAFTPDQFNELAVFLSGRGMLAGAQPG